MLRLAAFLSLFGTRFENKNDTKSSFCSGVPNDEVSVGFPAELLLGCPDYNGSVKEKIKERREFSVFVFEMQIWCFLLKMRCVCCFTRWA